MSKTKLLHQNFLLTFQKSLTSNIFLDPKEGVNPPSPPYTHVWLIVTWNLKLLPLLIYLSSVQPKHIKKFFPKSGILNIGIRRLRWT